MRTHLIVQLHSAQWRTGGARIAARPSRRRPGAGSVRDPRRAAPPACTSGVASPAAWASVALTRAWRPSAQTRSGHVGRSAGHWSPSTTSAAPSSSSWRRGAP